MELSEYERLNLMNQYQILAELSKDEYDQKHYMRNVEILASGYEYLYSDLGRIATGDSVVSREEAEEVLNILSMFQAIGFAIDGGVDIADVEPYALEFPGFDGNNESKQLGFAEFYCDGGKLFRRVVQDRKDLNSHGPFLPNMRRMLDEYNNSAVRNELTREDLIRITEARKP